MGLSKCLNDYSKHKNHQIRLKGRVIGRAGKTRELIETLTEAHISVYGKTIALIGPVDHVTVAAQAVDMLRAGSAYATGYKWLEKKHKVLKREEVLGKDEEVKEEFKKYLD
jgi:ribosomal RNA assembly protein